LDKPPFTNKELSLYNPVSWTSAMMNCDFRNYWYLTGNTSFLFQSLKKQKYDIEKIRTMQTLELEEVEFSEYDVSNLRLLPLLYQTGYLSIKTHCDNTYTLGYPNKEVEESFSLQSSYYYSSSGFDDTSIIYSNLIKAIRVNDIPKLIENLKVYYANVNYELVANNEKSYHLIFDLIFKNLAFKLATEVRTNKGRIDAVIETEKYIYIFEFKYNQTAEIAIRQIKEKEYYQKYLLGNKEIVLVGINFNGEKKQIDEFLIEEV